MLALLYYYDVPRMSRQKRKAEALKALLTKFRRVRSALSAF